MFDADFSSLYNSFWNIVSILLGICAILVSLYVLRYQRKPIISLNLTPARHIINMSIKNEGSAPARDIKLYVSVLIAGRKERIGTYHVDYLNPGEETTEIISYRLWKVLEELNLLKSRSFEIPFEDEFGEPYEVLEKVFDIVNFKGD